MIKDEILESEFLIKNSKFLKHNCKSIKNVKEIIVVKTSDTNIIEKVKNIPYAFLFQGDKKIIFNIQKQFDDNDMLLDRQLDRDIRDFEYFYFEKKFNYIKKEKKKVREELKDIEEYTEKIKSKIKNINLIQNKKIRLKLVSKYNKIIDEIKYKKNKLNRRLDILETKHNNLNSTSFKLRVLRFYLGKNVINKIINDLKNIEYTYYDEIFNVIIYLMNVKNEIKSTFILTSNRVIEIIATNLHFNVITKM